MRRILTSAGILRISLIPVFLFISGNASALICSEVRQLTLLYFKMHYSFNAFDDTLSERTLEKFLNAWDPGKIYFLKADIDGFNKKYAKSLDDKINQLDCSPIDEIMSLYSRRFEERQKVIYKLVAKKYDFTKEEYMIIDRKKIEYVKTTEDLNERWRKRIKYQLLSLNSNLDDLKKSREKLKHRYEIALKRHNELTKDKVFGVFLNAFASALDPHSSYMPADDLEDFRIRTRLSLEGIGASLRSEDGFTIVVSLVKGGAAEKGGLLKTNDQIIAVAQGEGEPVDVVDMELQEVVKLIRGARGTTVKLTVLREGASAKEKLILPIIREKIQLVDAQASSKLVELVVTDEGRAKKIKVGVINLPSFYIDFEGRHKRLKNYRSSSQDTKREIAKLKKQGAEALIMDLRSNGGGSLEESITMAGLFFEKGPVVQVRTQSGQTETYYDRDGETYWDGPLVVMINRHSASASEIFAGAIQDYGRGVIVGDSHTFGKGTVQNLNDVAARLGAVKVTVNKFYRASGVTTQLKGVEADIRLPSLVDEFDIGEKYYDYALPFESIAGSKHKKFSMVKPWLARLEKSARKRISKSKKFKELNEEIDKFRKNEKERSRVSLREKTPAELKKERAERKKAEEAEDDEQKDEFNLVNDIFLQETVKIAGDYVLMLKGKKAPGISTIPAVVAAEKKRAARAEKKQAEKKKQRKEKVSEVKKNSPTK